MNHRVRVDEQPGPVLADQKGHGVHRWLWQCDRCDEEWSCVVTCSEPFGATATVAVVQLARVTGWTVETTRMKTRCPKCLRSNFPHHS